MLSRNQDAFLALLRAGLWEEAVNLSLYQPIDFNAIYSLSQQQTVVGLIAAGLERTVDIKAPKDFLLIFAGEVLRLEQRNIAMNCFISTIVGRMRRAGVYALLVKGQGIAQCYERPLWRVCGDIDFFLSEESLNKAESFLSSMASYIGEREDYKQHSSFFVNNWEVELHGTLRSGLWKSIDRVLDESQKEIFCGGAVRSWKNETIQIFLPRADEDVIFVFSHILQHFFKGGVGLRQICDLCRLLYVYESKIDYALLESRLRRMKAMTEWKAFSALAVNHLGMPTRAMPFYSPDTKWREKADKILRLVFETGNFGNNRDSVYSQRDSVFTRKTKTLIRLSWDNYRQFFIFPIDSIKVWWNVSLYRLYLALTKN